MTYPQDPYGQNNFRDEPVFEYPAEDTFGPPPPARVNTLATLSVVFAFVFAPVGAVLGHLGLARIGRTGEPGRNRALAGLALSYTFIMLAVIALALWTTSGGTALRRTAAPGAGVGTSPAAPTVAAGDLAKLLPGIDEARRITGDRTLTAGQTWDRIVRFDREGIIDRKECWEAISPGTPDAYNVEAIFGFHASSFSDPVRSREAVDVIAGVAAARDAAAAQKQLASLLSGWHDCAASDVKVTFPSAQTLTFSVGVPSDGGDGITTLELSTRGIQRHSVRAIATKANVIIDLAVTIDDRVGSDSGGTQPSDRPRKAAVAIAKYVLGKIPG
jgi:eukaryotic-like serine/threonine-protein kinase